MELKTRAKNITIEVICLLYILLFIYAGLSKILDFHNFRIQLGQSPILSPLAGWVSILIPLIEFAIAILLIFKQTRFLGLLASFILMGLFSFYIYIILNYSSFIPCSCGGILEKMKWGDHLIFNLVFVVMAGLAFLILPVSLHNIFINIKSRLGLLSISVVLSGIVMFTLFNFSDTVTHYKNRFIRRFPQHTAQEIYQIDLSYNSYYFAGTGNGKLYLGNYTAPFQVMVLDTASRIKRNFHISLRRKNLPFTGPKIKVLNNDFFVFEGTVPYVFKGSTKNWNADLRINSGYLFSHAQPMDSTNLAVRYLVPKSGESAIGNLDLNDTLKSKFDTSLLQKQFDGIFDTDGTLLFNEQIKKIVYVYYYRNEYMVIRPQLKINFRGSTIDTVRIARIDLIQYKNSKLKTFAKPPLMVNKIAATYGEMLYINSTLPGLYESEKLWKTASIVDVYNLNDKTYRSSFPIYDIGGKKVKSIIIYGSFLYALIDHTLLCYKLRSRIAQNHAIKQQ
ncbi:DoxX family protein [Flavobacterium sp. FlaQc-47]|uniref:DoxX family protein n=1 Tax=Flavobacterium sp. FlaQc-47 TaxID=3374180 RepID=UPI003756E4F6